MEQIEHKQNRERNMSDTANKKPFETKVAIEVTKTDHKAVQQTLFDIGCEWYNGTELRYCGESVTHLCVTTLGTITMNTKGWDIDYPIVQLDDVVANIKRLHANRVVSAQYNIKRLDGNFTQAALTYARQVAKYTEKLEAAQKFLADPSEA